MDTRTISQSPHPPRRKSKFGCLFGLLLPPALLVGGFVYVTSPGFLKSVVLPRVADAADMSLTVGDIRLAPFSGLVLTGVKAARNDGSLEASASRAEVRYNLWKTLRGTVTVERVLVRDGAVIMRTAPVASPSPAPHPPDSGSNTSRGAPPALDIGEILLENTALHLIQPDQEIRITGMRVRIPGFVTGGELAAELAASFDVVQTRPQASGRLQGNLKLTAGARLTESFAPLSLHADLRVDSLRSEGVFDAAAEVAALTLRAAVTPREIEMLQLAFDNSRGESLGSISVMGPFNTETLDTDLALRVEGIGPAVLNLLGAPAGLSFGRSNLAASLSLIARDSFQTLKLSGRVEGQNLRVVRDAAQTPEVQVVLAPDLSVDVANEAARLNALSLTVTQGANRIVALTLEAPASVSWKGGVPSSDSLDLALALHNLDLAEWAPMTALPIRSGRLTLETRAKALENGRELAVSARGRVTRLGLNLEGLEATPLSAALDSQVRLQENAQGGHLFTGRLVLDQLAGRVQGTDLSPWSLQATLGGTIQDDRIDLSDNTLKVTQGGATALDLRAHGQYLTDSGSGEVRLEIREADFARLRTLAPEAPAVAGRLQGTLRLNAASAELFTVGAELGITGLSLPDQPPPPSPLRLLLSANATPTSAELKNVVLAWPAVAPFTNEVRINGNLDWGTPGALGGNLVVRGDVLNFTPWLPRPQPSPAPAAGPAPAAPAAPPILREPDPIPLPFSAFSVDAEIGALRAHDTRVEKLKLLVRADARSVRLERFEAIVEGAPVSLSAKADFSVPGFSYAVESKVAPLQIQPLVDTWVPDMRGKLSGTFFSDISLRGAGVTGPSLRKNLEGTFHAEVEKGRIVLLDENELKNEGLLSIRRLLGSVVGTLARALGIQPEELLKPPLTEVRVNANLGAGRLQIRNFRAVNPEVWVGTQGEVLLADDLPASVIRPMPITLGVSTNVAKRARIYRADRVRDDRVFLPPFVRVEGTVGKPNIDWDRSVISGLVISGVAERVNVGDERAQRILEGLGGLLSGEGPPPRPTPTPRPTAPAGAPTQPPAPTPTPSRAERALQGLELLRQLRATPAPAPAN